VFTQGRLKHNDKSTGVIYGAINSIHSYIQLFSPKTVVLVGEGKHSRDRRRELFAGYKLGRKANLPIPKEEFYSQVDYLLDVMYNLNVSNVAVDYFEADDVIAVLCKHYRNSQVIIVSTDGDYLQLITDTCEVYNPNKEITISLSNFTDVCGVAPIDFLSYKAMVGDSSDKIPGIKGVGEKTALEVCNFMGYDLFEESGYENIPKNIQKAFTPEAKEQYELAYKLIDLHHVPLTIQEVCSSLASGIWDAEEAKDLLEDIDCWSLLENWNTIEESFEVLESVC
jgi:5'-3' exonuclease